LNIPVYYVNAFSDKLFAGNPAVVCVLSKWLPEKLMQTIASEFSNVSETAFIVKQDVDDYLIRWFTPQSEARLCGHATIASAYVIMKHIAGAPRIVHFQAADCRLTVENVDDNFYLSLPVTQPKKNNADLNTISEILHAKVMELYQTDRYIAVLQDEEAVKKSRPDLNLLKTLPLRGLVITAPGSQHDYVLRYFAPKVGIDEDPVTGAAIACTVTIWQRKLHQTEFNCAQWSHRSGEVACTYFPEKNIVRMAGKARLFMQGELTLSS
jgi:PhzF family phenazine biosynthesis protein